MPYTYMPVSLMMKGRKCLVVGGGKVALRKVETLLEYDTSITVVAPEFESKLEYHANRGRIALEKREYQSPEASNFGLVISCTDDADLNRQVSEDCRSAGVPVNVADAPGLCDFIFPSVMRRDCMTAAIATDGRAPFISGHLNLVLDTVFPKHWERLMKHAAVFRRRVQERWVDDTEQKNACYGRFLDADWKSILESRTEEEVTRELDSMLES